jgi:type I restriction enzyme S subunit
LSQPSCRARFNSITTGQAYPQISLKQVRDTKVPLPPTKAEQEAIAEALSDADALIESLSLLLAKKRHLKQGAMQELLTGKKRLPGFSGEWEVKRLGELADIRSGGTPSTSQPQFWDGGVLWCTPTDITGLNGYKYLNDTSRKISLQGLKSSSAEIIPANSIVMTSRATIGECAINTVPVSTNQGFKNLIPFGHVDVEFLYYLLLMQKQGFISLCGGSTFLEIGKTQLAVFEVSLPATKTEQTAIAAILSDMDAELAALEAKLAKARSLKQGMMQELLTGRIRLVQPASNVIPFPQKAQPTPANTGSHNKQINEAVIIGVLSKHFGTENYPLPRKRRVKLTYLLHRYTAGKAEGYLKKAAGPYDPGTKYKGPETIALKNGYVREHHNGSYPGFVSGAKIVQAENYFGKWYGTGALAWLEQFKFKKTDELELLTTVDMAMVDLAGEGRMIDLLSVKAVIAGHPEWVPKLSREIFSDTSIERAISVCKDLFG